MPSGSRKADFSPEQYARQLAHSRAWKKRNREHLRRYYKDYRAKVRERESRIASNDAGLPD